MAGASADELLDLWHTGRQIPSSLATDEPLDLAGAYAISRAIRDRRVAAGDRVVGRKIGFTNTTIWDEYDVRAPIWGPIYASTVADLGATPFAVEGFPEPRIEPEIVFGFRAEPSLDMDDLELLGAMEWIAHGFEIVHSIYPGWKFAATDAVAAFGLHAGLRIGPKVSLLSEDVRRAFLSLGSLRIELRRNGELVDRGEGRNVLVGGPLAAIRHLIGVLDAEGIERIEAGEIITTGTLTKALPVAPGEAWSTRLTDVPYLEGQTIRIV